MFQIINSEDTTKIIQSEISAIINRLQQTESTWYMNSSNPKITVLKDLNDLLENKDDCWSKAGIKPYLW